MHVCIFYVAFVCFNELSLQTNENQESVTLTLGIFNPSLLDEVITVVITGGTATCKLIIFVLWLAAYISYT